MLMLLSFTALADSGRLNTEAEYFLDHREGFVWVTVSAAKSPSTDRSQQGQNTASVALLLSVEPPRLVTTQ